MLLIFLAEEAEQLSEAWQRKQSETAAVKPRKLITAACVAEGWQSKHGRQHRHCNGIQHWDIYLCDF